MSNSPPTPVHENTTSTLIRRAEELDAQRPWFERLLRRAFPRRARSERLMLAALREISGEAARDRATLATMRQHMADLRLLVDGLGNALRACEESIDEQGQVSAERYQEGLRRLLLLDQLSTEVRADLLAFGRVQAQATERIMEIEQCHQRASGTTANEINALRAQVADVDRENKALVAGTNRALEGTQAQFASAQQIVREQLESAGRQVFALAARLAETSAAMPAPDTTARLGMMDQRLQTLESATLAGPAFERFYLELENRFRGARQEISARLTIYLPYLETLGVFGTGQRAGARVADLGCGRGELIELLVQAGAKEVVGVDSNSRMIDACHERQLPVEQAEALDYLRRQPDRSFAALTAFHLVEHLPFSTLLALLNEAHRVLEPGGLLVLETPNCDNLLVASQNFHVDPTHRCPLPPLLLSFSVEQAGFCGIKTLLLHSFGPEYQIADSSPVAARFNQYFYGPQDYAVLATNV